MRNNDTTETVAVVLAGLYLLFWLVVQLAIGCGILAALYYGVRYLAAHV